MNLAIFRDWFRWWMPSCQYPVTAYGDGDQVIQVQRNDRCAATFSDTNDQGAILIPAEMLMPCLLPGIKQIYNVTGQWINRCDLVTLI